MFNKQTLIYLLTTIEVKTQRKSRIIEENPKIKFEKQSKKNPQIIEKIAESSFSKNKEQETAKGNIKTGFVLLNIDKTSLDCKTRNRNVNKINKLHFLKVTIFFSFKLKTPFKVN